MLSQAVGDYLKTIYKLQGDGVVSTTDIARSLDVSSASVTNMVKRLAPTKMVEYDSYKGVRLTEAGERNALEIIPQADEKYSIAPNLKDRVARDAYDAAPDWFRDQEKRRG